MTIILKDSNLKVLPVTKALVDKYYKEFLDHNVSVYLFGEERYPRYFISSGSRVYESVKDFNLKKDWIDQDLANVLKSEKDLWISKKDLVLKNEEFVTEDDIYFTLEKITNGLILRNEAIKDAWSLDYEMSDKHFIIKITKDIMTVFDNNRNILAKYKRGVSPTYTEKVYGWHPDKGERIMWSCTECKNFSWLGKIEKYVSFLVKNEGLGEPFFVNHIGYLSNRAKHKSAKKSRLAVWYNYPKIIKSNARLPKEKVSARKDWMDKVLNKYYQNINLGTVGDLSKLRKDVEEYLCKRFPDDKYVIGMYSIKSSLVRLFEKQIME